MVGDFHRLPPTSLGKYLFCRLRKKKRKKGREEGEKKKARELDGTDDVCNVENFGWRPKAMKRRSNPTWLVFNRESTWTCVFIDICISCTRQFIANSKRRSDGRQRRRWKRQLSQVSLIIGEEWLDRSIVN